MILHIAILDKFIPPFIDFLEANFDDFSKRHTFFIESHSLTYSIRPRENILFASDYDKWGKYIELLRLMYRASKIILHGLWSYRVVQLLALQPWLLKKCYWVIWGGDLYRYELEGDRDSGWQCSEKWRRFVIKRIGHLITFFDGEYELAKKWYGARGVHHKSFTYPSNICRCDVQQLIKHESINIQVGNSATYTNRHLVVIEKLSKYKGDNIKIYVPLSYGDGEYAKKVVARGASVFGEKFVPLLDFIPYDEYLKYLAGIDIAIFNQNRQQGVGNIITLLGMGKTVYMSSEVTSWRALRNLGLHIFDVEKLDIAMLTLVQAEENKKIVSECFSEANLIAQLKNLFGADLSKLHVSEFEMFGIDEL